MGNKAFVIPLILATLLIGTILFLKEFRSSEAVRTGGLLPVGEIALSPEHKDFLPEQSGAQSGNALAEAAKSVSKAIQANKPESSEPVLKDKKEKLEEPKPITVQPEKVLPAECVFHGAEKIGSKDILINEIAWMGMADGPDHEWIELKNNTAVPRKMGGWTLIDMAGQIRVVFDDQDIIPGNGFYLLERGSDASVSGTAADKIYQGALGNSDEGLRLFAPDCSIADEAFAKPNWPAGDNSTKATMERNNGDFLWHTSSIIGGTPKTANSSPKIMPPPPPPPVTPPPPIKPPPPVNPPPQSQPSPPPPIGGSPPPPLNPPPPPPPAEPPPPPNEQPPPPPTAAGQAAYPALSELFIDMTGADTQEFIELYNPTNQPVDISGWSLQYLSGSASSFGSVAKKNFVSGAAIPAFGFYLIGVGGYSASVPADMTWSQSLNNTAATVFLVNDQSIVSDQNDLNIVDRVGYGSGSGVFTPEGNPASLPPEGQTIERKAYQNGCVSAQGSGETAGNGCDTNENSADFEIRTTPSPQNAGSVPEPQ